MNDYFGVEVEELRKQKHLIIEDLEESIKKIIFLYEIDEIIKNT